MGRLGMKPKDGNYYQWYAWRPVKCDDGSIAFRKYVWRRTFHYFGAVYKTHYKTDEEIVKEEIKSLGRCSTTASAASIVLALNLINEQYVRALNWHMSIVDNE